MRPPPALRGKEASFGALPWALSGPQITPSARGEAQSGSSLIEEERGESVAAPREDHLTTMAEDDANGGAPNAQGEASSSPLVLDLCGSQMHDEDFAGVAVPEGIEELDLTENRLKDVDERILQLRRLRKATFRKNLLKDVSSIARFASAANVDELVLYDNHIRELPDLGGFTALKRLDVSYNQLRSMAPSSNLVATLEELFLAANKIAKVEGLGGLTRLRVLELGSNRIRCLEGLGAMTSLEELWLGRNKIREIPSPLAGPNAMPGALARLRRLSLQNNRLTSMAGLEGCPLLEELYLSFNGIDRLAGLRALRRLKILDLGNNRIAKLEASDLEGLECLEDLWLNDNSIPFLAGLLGSPPEEKEEGKEGGDGAAAGAGGGRGPSGGGGGGVALAPVAPSLRTLYLEGNPVAKDPGYKRVLVQALPALTQLDFEDIPR